MKPERERGPRAPDGGAPEGTGPQADERDAELHRLREALAASRALLREREEQWRAARAGLQVTSRLAAVGTLAAGIAHQINNPLGGSLASLGFAVEVLEELPEARRDERVDAALEALRDAREAGQRIAAIVHELAVFGSVAGEPSPVRVEDEVDHALGSVQAPAGTSLRLERSPTLPVMAVPGQIQHLVASLLDNAVKAIPAGRAGSVTVRVGPGGHGTARIEVSDDGVGMTPEVRARVFDPFFTTRPAGQGTGLGLAACHAIATAQGGTITVESEPGKGSTFRVELPVN